MSPHDVEQGNATAEPWQLALPFFAGIVIIWFGSVAMSFATRRVVVLLQQRIKDEEKAAGEEYHIPKFLQPELVPNIVEWGADVAQVLGLVLAPIIGLTALFTEGDFGIILTLILLVTLAGFSLFAFIHHFANPVSYGNFAKDWQAWISAGERRRKWLLPASWMLTIARVLRMSFVTTVGLAINLLFAVTILLSGYWSDIWS